MEGEPSRVERSIISLKVKIFLRSSTIRIKFPVHLGELLVFGLLASLTEIFLRMPIGDETRLDDVKLLPDNIDLDDLIGIGEEEGLGEEEEEEEVLTSCLLFLLTLGDACPFTGCKKQREKFRIQYFAFWKRDYEKFVISFMFHHHSFINHN